ncbi:MAG TPA: CDP-alcohol phosphatidyltransferase family protein [Balneolales bacterium]|nr:CDP-alcohol phosphatidyltransferase family protein [Balneolales bacterium]
MKQKLPGYLVHAFTALGAALGLWALFATAGHQFQLALWLLAAAAVIDSVDGALARKAQVKVRIPEFDGGLLDNIIDYLTWTIVPLFWAWEVLSVPTLVVIICGMASVIGFSRTDAKTEDHFFKGFPNYWNLVVLHMYSLHFSPTGASIGLFICVLFVFIPMVWIYPSRSLHFRKTMLILGGLYGIQLLVMITLFPHIPSWLAWSALIYPVIYFTGSLYLNYNRSRH